MGSLYLYQEKITPPDPLPARTKPPDVPTLQHIIKSPEQENAWLKEQLARRAIRPSKFQAFR
jgi:hypothetical protein